MIREQIEIRDAIDTIFPISPSGNGRTYEQALMASGFEEGVKWADNNPKSPWINVNDDLPCNHEELFENSSIYDKETKCVIACDNEHNIDFDYMVNCDGKWSWARNESNTHWFIIPKLPNM